MRPELRRRSAESLKIVSEIAIGEEYDIIIIIIARFTFQIAQ